MRNAQRTAALAGLTLGRKENLTADEMHHDRGYRLIDPATSEPILFGDSPDLYLREVPMYALKIAREKGLTT